MIKSGRVVCTDAGVAGKKMEDMRIGAGGHFGERALLLAAPRAANVTAEEEVRRGFPRACMLCWVVAAFPTPSGRLGRCHQHHAPLP
jgi:hypothetical protein